MIRLKGIAASNGVAIAKAYRLENPKLIIEKKTVSNSANEIKRFEGAIEISRKELDTIRIHAEKELGPDKAAIFEAHLLVLDDPELHKPVIDSINNDKRNAEFALNEVANTFITMFESMNNEYMQERAADIKDVTKRVLAHLLDVTISNPSEIYEEVIIIAEDLTPSDTAQLNRQYALGFATDIGGRTSHSAIMARSLEIPAVVGTGNITSIVKSEDIIILDGIDGEIIINPTDDVLKEFETKKQEFNNLKKEWQKFKDLPTITNDGHHVELAANIGTPEDMPGVINNGAEGIGLYRTEFLYMGRTNFPSEEEQFKAYKAVLEGITGNKPVVIRTLDIGGDKELPYLDMPHEMNPFLGYRAIRLCLDQKEIFRTQLRALLRASIYGNLKIMFPMIATVEEFRAAKALLFEEKEKLISEGIEVSNSIEVGIMIEIPSSAVIADIFAKEVDFFSFGTNDLIQYTMAADRMSEKVAYLYQPCHPAILRLIKMVIDAANKEGKWAGMCGEMAGDPLAIPLLVGLGLHEFSMSATSVLPARIQISKLSKKEMEDLANKALNMSTADEVVNLVKSTLNYK